jgi:hypothetical protein
MPTALRIWAIVGLLLLCARCVQGQFVYFDRTYDIDNMTERCSNVLYDSGDNYIFFTSGIRFTSQGGTHLTSFSVDELGEPHQIDSHFEDSSRFEIGHIEWAHDGGIVCFFSKSTSLHNFNFFLRKVTSDGEFLWERQYGDSALSSAAVQMIRTAGHGFLLVGQESSGIDGDMHVIKTDSLGHLQWERSYGGSLFDCGTSAVQTPDGGFLILGWTRSFGNGQRDFYLVKVDSLGNLEWQRTYGGGDMETGMSIIALIDDNFLLAGAQVNGGINKGKIIKINPTGGIIWQKEYIHPDCTACEVNQVKELADGTIAGTGVCDKVGEGNSGWLFKANAVGNEVWQRKYNKNQYTDLFYHVLATEDAGFLLSGQALLPGEGGQNAWLLKVDSVGCTYADCLVGVDELSSKVVADVWPNPASSFLNIEWQEAGEAAIRLFDMTGKQVLRQSGSGQREVVDVSGLPSGLYMLQLVQGEMKSSSRIVVQH